MVIGQQKKEEGHDQNYCWLLPFICLLHNIQIIKVKVSVNDVF